jgi:hypothetical protein
MRIMTFAAGMAVGYVLGARAGRDKYEQIVGNARRLRDNPTAGQLLEATRDLSTAPASAATAASSAATAAPAPVKATPPPARPVKAAAKKTAQAAAGVE